MFFFLSFFLSFLENRFRTFFFLFDKCKSIIISELDSWIYFFIWIILFAEEYILSTVTLASVVDSSMPC